MQNPKLITHNLVIILCVNLLIGPAIFEDIVIIIKLLLIPPSPKRMTLIHCAKHSDLESNNLI